MNSKTPENAAAVEPMVMMPDRFFSYDPDNGFETHQTLEQAKSAAGKCLGSYRDDAHEGWADEVTGICWGEIKQIIAETERRPRTDEDNCDPDLDEFVDYKLVDAS
jgi:hypothetical protein